MLFRSRQSFAGKRTFEFVTMLSFAIPGTVIGVSYILAFNVPPVELTGTGIILIICFVFRNMPVGVRAGIATLSQIDKSLDEASLTLGARTFTTVRRIVLPLLRPALVAAWLMLFVIFIRELGATMLLFAQGTETISVAMVILSERSSGYVAALAIIQLLLQIGRAHV